MLDTHLVESVKNLSSSDRIALVEYAVSLLRDDIASKPSSPLQEKQSLVSFLDQLSAAGEEALRNGAPPLPSDFAENHDYYLYGAKRK